MHITLSRSSQRESHGRGSEETAVQSHQIRVRENKRERRTSLRSEIIISSAVKMSIMRPVEQIVILEYEQGL